MFWNFLAWCGSRRATWYTRPLIWFAFLKIWDRLQK